MGPFKISQVEGAQEGGGDCTLCNSAHLCVPAASHANDVVGKVLLQRAEGVGPGDGEVGKLKLGRKMSSEIDTKHYEWLNQHEIMLTSCPCCKPNFNEDDQHII